MKIKIKLKIKIILPLKYLFSLQFLGGIDARPVGGEVRKEGVSEHKTSNQR